MPETEPIRFWITSGHCDDCASAVAYDYRYNNIFGMRFPRTTLDSNGRKRCPKRKTIRFWLRPDHCKQCLSWYVYDRDYNDIFSQVFIPPKERKEYALRVEALRHYSDNTMQCACCGESEIDFLALDHINGGGGKHRKEVGRGYRFIRWLQKNNYPDGFQVLCHNCNQAKSYYDGCPHMRRGITS